MLPKTALLLLMSMLLLLLLLLKALKPGSLFKSGFDLEKCLLSLISWLLLLNMLLLTSEFNVFKLLELFIFLMTSFAFLSLLRLMGKLLSDVILPTLVVGSSCVELYLFGILILLLLLLILLLLLLLLMMLVLTGL